MIRAHHIGDESTFLGQTCALCKQEFVSGDDIVVCPEDGSRHHVGCWEANGNKCTAYGCRGEGAVGVAPFPSGPRRARPSATRPRLVNQRPDNSSPARSSRPAPGAPGSKIRTLPAGGIGCSQTCLLVIIAMAIVLAAAACFGIWAITNYLALDIRDLPYQTMLSPHLANLSVLLNLGSTIG